MKELKLFYDYGDYCLFPDGSNSVICLEAARLINPFLLAGEEVIKIKVTEKNPKKKGWTRVLFYQAENDPQYLLNCRAKIKNVTFFDFYFDCVELIKDWCKANKTVWVKIEVSKPE